MMPDKEFLSKTLGNLFFEKMKGIGFVYENSDYFSEHRFHDIPESLRIRVEAFAGCDIVKSVWPTNTRFKEITSGASEFLNCIFTQPPFLLADLMYQKSQDSVDLKMLFGKNSSIPECNDLVDKLELNKPSNSEMFEKRICDRVVSNVIVSDSGACLMLANNEETDMTNAVVGYEKKFIQWCNDFFYFKWMQGENFARLRV
ncbi:transcriptional regulator-like protein [Nitrosopumilus sp. K4]|uniref:transcriptional regulator-like protein n=1 Tax=Nitrosopumilus sp. K4 TaxID=2795383 RepID=UPI001BA6BC2C|nr:transcriptional regulator-like protein [Nitrosopumilus sp. K4]QUC65542.1 transcriptional regulator-like protein [Nitrosopumilus sp. K4]